MQSAVADWLASIPESRPSCPQRDPLVPAQPPHNSLSTPLCCAPTSVPGLGGNGDGTGGCSAHTAVQASISAQRSGGQPAMSYRLQPSILAPVEPARVKPFQIQRCSQKPAPVTTLRGVADQRADAHDPVTDRLVPERQARAASALSSGRGYQLPADSELWPCVGAITQAVSRSIAGSVPAGPLPLAQLHLAASTPGTAEVHAGLGAAGCAQLSPHRRGDMRSRAVHQQGCAAPPELMEPTPVPVTPDLADVLARASQHRRALQRVSMNAQGPVTRIHNASTLRKRPCTLSDVLQHSALQRSPPRAELRLFKRPRSAAPRQNEANNWGSFMEHNCTYNAPASLRTVLGRPNETSQVGLQAGNTWHNSQSQLCSSLDGWNLGSHAG
jgi:hypothetical protein